MGDPGAADGQVGGPRVRACVCGGGVGGVDQRAPRHRERSHAGVSAQARRVPRVTVGNRRRRGDVTVAPGRIVVTSRAPRRLAVIRADGLRPNVE